MIVGVHVIHTEVDVRLIAIHVKEARVPFLPLETPV